MLLPSVFSFQIHFGNVCTKRAPFFFCNWWAKFVIYGVRKFTPYFGKIILFSGVIFVECRRRVSHVWNLLWNFLFYLRKSFCRVHLGKNCIYEAFYRFWRRNVSTRCALWIRHRVDQHFFFIYEKAEPSNIWFLYGEGNKWNRGVNRKLTKQHRKKLIIVSVHDHSKISFPPFETMNSVKIRFVTHVAYSCAEYISFTLYADGLPIQKQNIFAVRSCDFQFRILSTYFMDFWLIFFLLEEKSMYFVVEIEAYFSKMVGDLNARLQLWWWIFLANFFFKD